MAEYIIHQVVLDKQCEIETFYDAYLEAKYEGYKSIAKDYLKKYHQAIKELNVLYRKYPAKTQEQITEEVRQNLPKGALNA